MRQDKGVAASPPGHSGFAPDPVPGSGHSASVPNAEEAFCRGLLKYADKVRAKPLSEFGGNWLSGAIREGIAKGFEEEAYRRCPLLRPEEPPSLWRRLKRAFQS